jgi:hypothetical protein
VKVSRKGRKNKNRGRSVPLQSRKPVYAPTNRKQSVRWKWSYDGKTDKLRIWPTDTFGDPSHFQTTGPEYYKYAQGRIYVYGDGPRDSIAPDENVEIMVWQDRGTKPWQEAAVEKVNQWLTEHFNHPADNVTGRQEFSYMNYVNDNITDLDEQAQRAMELDTTEDESTSGKDYVQALIDKPIEQVLRGTDKTYAWAFDGKDFNARQVDGIPSDSDFSRLFGTDSDVWSAQGEVTVRDGYVTLTIHHEKPLAYEGNPLELHDIQSKARTEGMKWIKDILKDHVDLVKEI